MNTTKNNKENITASTAANFFHKKQYSWLQLLVMAMSAVLLTAYVFTGANNWLLIVLASVLFIVGAFQDSAMSRWINS